jgi:hypothetical protein
VQDEESLINVRSDDECARKTPMQADNVNYTRALVRVQPLISTVRNIRDVVLQKTGDN